MVEVNIAFDVIDYKKHQIKPLTIKVRCILGHKYIIPSSRLYHDVTTTLPRSYYGVTHFFDWLSTNCKTYLFFIVVSIVKSFHLILKNYMPCLKLRQNPKIPHKNMYNMFLAKTQRRKINTLCGDAKGNCRERGNNWKLIIENFGTKST